jgi:mono/diheme cytochrome c family protein
MENTAMAKVQDELMHHDYDGIQEYDNDLPGWWKNLFWVTIVFAVLYLSYYHVFGGPSSAEEYMMETGTYIAEDEGAAVFGTYKSPYASAEGEVTPAARAVITELLDQPFAEQLKMAMSKADADQLAKLEAAFPEIYAEYLSGGPAAAVEAAPAEPAAPAADLAVLTDDASLASGKQIWDTQCFTCHKLDGGGLIGPNMTDDYWIHGGSLPEIINLINVGVPAKGMIPWKGTLSPTQIHEVSSYILVKLVGTDPPGAKAPEGEKVSS